MDSPHPGTRRSIRLFRSLFRSDSRRSAVSRSTSPCEGFPRCRRPLIETRCHFRILPSSWSAGWPSHGISTASIACSGFVSLFRHSFRVRTLLLFCLRFLGLTAPAIPVRSGLRVFCFLGSALTPPGPSQNADASLRLPAPSLSVVPQETGAENEVIALCI